MDTYFADTFYYLALSNPKDSDHDRVSDWIKRKRFREVTTEFVLIEVADGLCSKGLRAVFLKLLHRLRTDHQVRIEPASQDLLNLGIDLLRRYTDKQWGLTDCTSFVIMDQEKLTKALTVDRHYRQRGYVELLKP